MARLAVKVALGFVLSASAALAAPPAATTAAPASYKLEYTPFRQVEVVETCSTKLPGYAIKEWVLFQLLPPATAREALTLTLEPGGQEGFTTGAGRHPLAFIREVFSAPKQNPEITYKIIYRGALNRTALVPLKDGEKPPHVPALTPALRQHYTTATTVYDFGSPELTAWLDKDDLHRHAGEQDLDLARRIYLNMHANFRWFDKSARNSKASDVVRDHAAVCVGLSHAYAAALRANGIPARSLTVRVVSASTAPDNTANFGHATNEFFIDAIGWLPADITFAVSHKASDEAALGCFGGDGGNFLIEADEDAPPTTVDTVHFGQKDKAQPAADFRKQSPLAIRTTISGAAWGFEYTGSGSGKTEHHDTYVFSVSPLAIDPADPTGQSRVSAAANGCNMWHDSNGWHLQFVPPKNKSPHYEITITPNAGTIDSYRLSGKDQATAVPELKLDFTASETTTLDFSPGKDARTLRFDLKADATAIGGGLIRIGQKKDHPAQMPFLLAANGEPSNAKPAPLPTAGQ